MMISTIRYLHALLIIWALSYQVVFADDGRVEIGSKARAHWAYLISGWRAEREKLRSFDLRIKGFEQSFKGRASGVSGELVDLRGRNEINLRFVRDPTGSKRKNVVQWGHAVQCEGTWIATANCVAEYVKNNASVVDLIKPNDKRQEFAFNFDPEVVGFCGMIDLHQGNYEDQMDLVERVTLKTFSLHSLTSLGQGRYKAILDVGNTDGGYTYREVVTINEEKGHSFEDREHYAHYNAKLPGAPPEAEIHTDWIRHGDLWVPSKVRETHREAHLSSDVKFDWIAINTSIPESEFEIDSMGAPKGTMIVDQRLGRDKSIILGRTGGPQPFVLDRNESSQHVVVTTPPNVRGQNEVPQHIVASLKSESAVRSSTLVIAISGSILLIVACLFVFFVVRRLRS